VPEVGLYREHVVPRLIDWGCGAARFERWRAQAAEGLCGQVVEIGFGSGLNVRHYPPEVEVILAVEPAGVAWRMAARRIGASPVRAWRIGLDGQDLPLHNASCDAALCTFTLCTLPEPEKALSELRRVVRPGGTLHFAEHGLSPQAGVVKWQHRIEPLWRELAGGCHLTRDPTMLVERAGFAMERTEQGYVRGPKPLSWLTFGVASNPGP
jgi:SAM-dependent methyltransferase